MLASAQYRGDDNWPDRWQLLVIVAVMLFLLFCLLSPANCGDGLRAARPVLIIATRDDCYYCRVFDNYYFSHREFREAIQRAYGVPQKLDTAKPMQEARAKRLGIDRVPSFVAVRGDAVLSIHVGFDDTEECVSEFMRDLKIEWPPSEMPQQQASPKPQIQSPPAAGPGTIQSPVPQSETVDRFAREGVSKLINETQSLAKQQLETQSSVEQLQTSLAGLATQLSRTSDKIDANQAALAQQLKASETSTTLSVQQSIQQILSQVNNSEAEQQRPPPKEQHLTPVPDAIFPSLPDLGPPGQLPGTMPEQTEEAKPASGDTASRWLAVLSFVGKTGLAIAAPEIAIPGTAALGVIGYGLTWLRNRRRSRQPGPIGSATNPIRVSDTSEVKTETKFVVNETDVLGEAFQEAIRRVGNQHRETSPAVTDALRQVVGAAEQLAHGRRVARRPTKLTQPETIP